MNLILNFKLSINNISLACSIAVNVLLIANISLVVTRSKVIVFLSLSNAVTDKFCASKAVYIAKVFMMFSLYVVVSVGSQH